MKLSIVVPVCKVEKYLRQCLDSILAPSVVRLLGDHVDQALRLMNEDVDARVAKLL